MAGTSHREYPAAKPFPAPRRRKAPQPPGTLRRIRRQVGGFVAYLCSWWRY
ncbi:MAG TPA: hypothetical protein VG860_17650 [Terriglobia bacterium]|nr:hypothetical protein [Terriglobia bacterium]